jgi:hypothetical protein
VLAWGTSNCEALLLVPMQIHAPSCALAHMNARARQLSCHTQTYAISQPCTRSHAQHLLMRGCPPLHSATQGAVERHEDRAYGMIRTEITCANCGYVRWPSSPNSRALVRIASSPISRALVRIARTCCCGGSCARAFSSFGAQITVDQPGALTLATDALSYAWRGWGRHARHQAWPTIALHVVRVPSSRARPPCTS